MQTSRVTALLCSISVASACGSGSSGADVGGAPDSGSSAADVWDAAADAWDDAQAPDTAFEDAALADAGFGDADPDDQGLVDGGPIDAGHRGIGPAGGTVQGPGGAQIVVPAGALSDYVEISVATASATNPSFPPPGIDAAGLLYEVLPHGTAFALPVTLRLPYEPARVSAGATLHLYRAQPGGTFSEIASATIAGDLLEASVSSFSYYGPGTTPPPGLAFSELTRQCARESLGGNVWCWGGMGVIAMGSGLAEPPPLDTMFREPTRLPPRSLTNVVSGPGWVCGLDVLNVWCIGDAQLTRIMPPPGSPPAREWVQKALPAGVVLTELTAGGRSVCGLGAANSPDTTAVGKIFCWGDNTVGELGRDVYSNAWEVLPVDSPHRYAAIGAAGSFTCGARVGTGEVDCWGGNIYGGVAPYSLGSFDMTATPMPRGITVDPRPGALVGAGGNACGLGVDGTATCWGDNFEGQMGNGTTSPYGHNYRVPSEVPGIKFKSIWPGPTMCGIALDDRTYCWGHATEGSLGNGHDDAGGPPANATKQTTPTLVSVPLGVIFESMAITDNGRCAKSTTNEVYCWGTNRFFDLGIGSDNPPMSNLPVPIKSRNLLRMMP